MTRALQAIRRRDFDDAPTADRRRRALTATCRGCGVDAPDGIVDRHRIRWHFDCYARWSWEDDGS